MKIRLTLLGLLLSMIVQFAAAQTTEISGIVRDTDGQPVVGAAVAVKGSKAGALTDINGKFTIKGVKAGTTLVFSYIGMESKEAKAKKDMKVFMSYDSNQLDEVMVVAFGKQKRSSFTGSAGIVDSKNLEKKQVTNALSALNGEIAGVQMTDVSGDPASTPTIRIRGFSSISAGKDPLIILDGAPYDGGINNINPSDIESVTVLKDAASNALYGARGANGVIMITTKTAAKGENKTTITLDAKLGANSNAAVDYDYIDNPAEYYEMFYKAVKNQQLLLGESAYNAHVNANKQMVGASADGGLGYIAYTVPNGEYLIGENGKLNPHAKLGNRIYNKGQYYTILPDDWTDLAYRTALRQEYNLSVSSSLKNAQIYASLGYLDNEGIVYNSGYERYTARLKANWQAKKWLSLGGNVSFAHSDRDYVADDDTGVFWMLRQMAPIYPAYVRDGEGNIMTDSNGKVYDYGDGNIIGLARPVLSQTNVLQENELNTQNMVRNNFTVSGFVDITPIDGLKITLNGTVTDNQSRETYTYQPFYGYTATSFTNGGIEKVQSQTYSLNFQQLINYTKTFGKHNMSLMFGHENYKYRYDYLYGFMQNMASYFGNQNLSGAITVSSTGDYNSDYPTTDYNNEGYFFRGMYDYAEKYFGSFSFRRDASSRFHPDHQWGNFFSVGGAWIISKENWFKAKWVDQLKLKASIGQQGNDNIGEYAYMDLYSISNNNGSIGLTSTSKGNENITWETNTNLNVGAEFSLFKGRLTGSVEYFYRHTKDMLCFVYAPYESGYSGSYDNIGSMDNKGIEVELNGILIKNKNLTWSVNLNATHYKNEVKELNADNKTLDMDGHWGYVSGNNDQFTGEGLSLYTWYLKKYAGVNDEGLSTWYKSDGTTTTNVNDADYFLSGNAVPDLYGGFGTKLEAYGFDFSVSFNYSIGGKAYDSMYASLMANPYGSTTGFAFHRDLYNAWSETNTSSNIPRFVYSDKDNSIDANNSEKSTRFLTDASYLTLQNINIGYTLPKAIVRKLGLSNLRIYGSIANLYYWSKRKGFDPRGSFSGKPDTDVYSPMKSISGGVNIQF